MKQTKSALTMLLAHYRAIYKHAILAAFVAASTLGAGSAVANKGIDEATGTISGDDATFEDAPIKFTDGFTQTGIFTVKILTPSINKITAKNGVFNGSVVLGTSLGKGELAIDLSSAGPNKGRLEINGSIKSEHGESTLNLKHADAYLGEKGSLEVAQSVSNGSVFTLDSSNLHLTQAQLAGFLNADGNGIVTAKDGTKGTGHLTLKNSILDITGTTIDAPLKLTKNLFVETRSLAGSDGKIDIDTAATIKSNSILVEAALGAGAGKDKLTVEAKDLTLGKAGSAIANDLNASFKVSNSLNFISTGDITLANKYTLSSTGTGSVTSTHNIKLDGGTAGSGMVYEQGSWNVDKKITLSGEGIATDGLLKVSGLAKKSVDVTLAELDLSGATTSANPHIVVGGADAGKSILNLQNTNINILKADGKTNNDGQVVTVNENGTLNTSLENFNKLLKGKLSVTSGATPDTEAIINITDGKLKLTEDSLKDAADSDVLGFTGTLKGMDLVVSEGTTKNNGITIAGDAKAKLEFNTISFEIGAGTNKTATLTTGNITVKDGLSVNSDAGLGTLTLGTGNLVLDKGTTGASDLNVETLTLTNGDLTVKGNWSFNDADVELTAAKKFNVDKGASVSGGGLLTIKNDATSQLGGSAEFKQLTVEQGKTYTVSGKGGLTLNGTYDKDTTTGEITSGKPDLILKGNLNLTTGGNLTLGKYVADEFIDLEKGELVTGHQIAQIKGDGSSEIKFNFDKDVNLDVATLKKLNEAFTAAGSQFKGFINVGQANINGLDGIDTNKDNKYQWSEVKDLANINMTNDTLKQAIVYTTKSDATSGLRGSFGAFNVDEQLNSGKVKVTGNTTLSNAKDNGNFFVSAKDKDGKQVAGNVNVNNSTLSLQNGGNIGAIALETATSELLVQGGTTSIAGNVTGQGNATFDAVKSTVTGNVDVAKFVASSGSSVKANGLKSANIDIAKANVDIAGTVDMSATNSTAKVSEGSLTAQNLKLATAKPGDAPDLVLDKGASLVVDGEGKNGALTGSAGISLGHMQNKDKGDKVESSSASMFVRNTDGFTGVVELTSGVNQASMAVISGKEKEAEVRMFGNAPTSLAINHTADVGNNAVLAYGFDSVDEVSSLLRSVNLLGENGKTISTEAKMAKDGDKVNPMQGDALAVINTPTTVSATGGFTLNAQNQTPGLGADGNVTLGNYSQLVLTDKAFGENMTDTALATTTGKNVVVTTGANTRGVLVGNFTNEKTGLQVFSDKALTGVEKFTLYTANGILKAEVGVDGKIASFILDEEALKSGKVLQYASTPVREYIKGIMLNDATKLHTIVVEEKVPENGKTGPAGKPSNALQLTAEEMKTFNATNEFINNLANSLDGGKGFEQSARFAVYGGVVKGAELAAKAGYEAVQGYAENTIAAATVQNEMGSFFVVPTYKSSDSDSFNAEGLDFGSDVSLSGVALGADFVVAPAVKLGAMFNIGTGDAKGQGAASGVDSDLDYVGVGLFARYEDNGINVVADLSYTKSGSDITATIKDNQVKADLDTKVLSLGVKGSYKFDLDGSYAKPYAGIRFSKYDLDDYTLSAQGLKYMTGSYDDMTVVSVPVGIQLGTDIMAGDWSLTPSLDLGVTFNLGDTDLSHSAQAITKTEGMKLTSEVIDDVVFGIKGGLKANYQALSLGLGLGYEMGSNSDDLSVQGTIKYTF